MNRSGAAASRLTASGEKEKAHGDEGDFGGVGEIDEHARGHARADGEERFRRRSRSFQGVQRHPRRPPVRLFQAAGRTPTSWRRWSSSPRRRGRGPARRDVRRREDQHHREARGAAHRAAQFLRQARPGRRPGRHARGDRDARRRCSASPRTFARDACAARSASR